MGEGEEEEAAFLDRDMWPFRNKFFHRASTTTTTTTTTILSVFSSAVPSFSSSLAPLRVRTLFSAVFLSKGRLCIFRRLKNRRSTWHRETGQRSVTPRAQHSGAKIAGKMEKNNFLLGESDRNLGY